jgi:hypothetical protein
MLATSKIAKTNYLFMNEKETRVAVISLLHQLDLRKWRGQVIFSLRVKIDVDIKQFG